MADSFSRYDVYAVAGSRYCYPNTSVLKNRFGLKDAVQLKKIEADISVIRQNDLLEHPIARRFTATHLCTIHRYLFGDVYPFAGPVPARKYHEGKDPFLSTPAD